MAKLFGVDIQKEVAKALKNQLLKGTLTKVTRIGRDPLNPTGGEEKTTVTYEFDGFMESAQEVRAGNTLIVVGGKYVSVVGGSLPEGIEPETADKINIEDTDFEIISIANRDPASAMFKCRVEA